MRQIRVRDMMDELGRVKDKLGMEREIGEVITFVEFFRTRTELYRLQNLVTEGSMLVKTLKNMFRTVTKGSQILRLAVTTKEQ